MVCWISVLVEVISPLIPVSHSYEHLSLTLIPFRCRVLEGNPQPLSHQSIEWVSAQTVSAYDFAEADIPILEEYLRMEKFI